MFLLFSDVKNKSKHSDIRIYVVKYYRLRIVWVGRDLFKYHLVHLGQLSSDQIGQNPVKPDFEHFQ